MELTESDRLAEVPSGPAEEAAARTAGDGHLGVPLLEQLRHGTLPPGLANEAKRHLDACEGCRASWQALLAAEPPFARRPGPPDGRPRRTPVEQVGLWAPAIAVAVAVAFALAGGMSRGAFGITVTQPTIEVKRTAAGQRMASVRGGTARYLLLFSREGPGPWTLAWPRDAQESGPLARRGRTTPDVPDGASEVLGVFSERPVARTAAEQALLASGATPAVPGTWLVRLTLSP